MFVNVSLTKVNSMIKPNNGVDIEFNGDITVIISLVSYFCCNVTTNLVT